MNDDAQKAAPPLPPADSTNSETYSASCHCGSVSYSVQLSPPLPEWKVVSCNCSICSRNGYYLVYPQRSQLHITTGEEYLKQYTFGTGKNLHKFCGQCGSSVFFDPRMLEFGEGDGTLDLLGINVRMFHGVVLEQLNVVHVEDRYPSSSREPN